MILGVILAVTSWFDLLGEASARKYYYLDILEDKQLDRDYIRRNGEVFVSDAPARLYRCRNAHMDGTAVIWCKSLNRTEEAHACNSATFFSAYRPLTETPLWLDEVEYPMLPLFMSVGFPPRHPHWPNFQTSTRDKEVERVIQVCRSNGCLPDQEEDIKDLLDYVKCNNVGECVIDKSRHIIDTTLQVLQGALEWINGVHHKHHSPQARVKKFAMKRLPSYLTKSPLWKKVGWASSPRRETSTSTPRSIPIASELKAISKLMVNKLLDPCTFKRYVKKEDKWNEKYRIDKNCRIYCQFLGVAVEMFVPTSVPYPLVYCSHLIDGKCNDRDVCVCERRIPTPIRRYKPEINMLYCDNMLRRKLSKIELPIQRPPPPKYTPSPPPKYTPTPSPKYTPSPSPISPALGQSPHAYSGSKSRSGSESDAGSESDYGSNVASQGSPVEKDEFLLRLQRAFPSGNIDV
nr:PREDICTED: uncharacterized protein LOC109040560 [Bemisia tabaci]